MRTLILSDIHCGSIFGLTPPQWQRKKDDGFQPHLWDWYCERIYAHAPYDLVLFLGDATEGIGKRGNIDIGVNDTNEQAKMAVEVLRKIPLSKSARIEFCYGTPFHGTGSSKHEDLVAVSFDAVPAKTHRLIVDGVRINAEHTGRRSGTAYGQASQAALPAVKDELRAQRGGGESANIYYRAHVHYYFLSSWCNKDGVVRAYNVPCLKYPFDDFAIALDPMMYNMGFMVHEFKDGHMTKECLEIFDWETKGEIWKYKTV